MKKVILINRTRLVFAGLYSISTNATGKVIQTHAERM